LGGVGEEYVGYGPPSKIKKMILKENMVSSNYTYHEMYN
jgi:hypothetical protein